MVIFRNVVGVLALTLASLFYGAPALDAAPEPAPAHTNTDAYNICAVFDTYWWGPEVNNALRLKWTAFHYYGLHYVQCCYDIAPYGYNAHGIYSIDYGTWDWLPGDAWCPNS
jgi:hypothetical protein